MSTPDFSETALPGRPIGIFDSGVGGLTVMREVARQLPQESLIYFGDTQRCPYGPRPLTEIRQFAAEIVIWLVKRGVKLIVIACNSATAAALEVVQRFSPVPVIGVIEPGARAAVKATLSRRVGVIGTRATIESGVYAEAIRRLDKDVTVFSAATPRFVEMVEQGLRLDRNPLENFIAPVSSIYVRPAFQEIARDYLEPLRRCAVDTLVLGCTHYPLIAPLISSVMGSSIRIISSAAETAADVRATLAKSDQLAPPNAAVNYRFATTASDPREFSNLGTAILGRPLDDVTTVSITELEAGLQLWHEAAAKAKRGEPTLPETESAAESESAAPAAPTTSATPESENPSWPEGPPWPERMVTAT